MLLGVDVGGTFTDAVVFDGRSLHTAKSPTTTADQSEGVIAARNTALDRAGESAKDVETFAHGMTVGTNALLTESGAKTALVATKGFTDLLAIGRQNRPRLYHPCTPRPAPLATAVFGAAERVGPEGIIEPLAEGEPNRLAEEIKASGAESVAVCLLFAYVDSTHEHAIAEHLRSALPGVHVSAAHEVLPQFREYERCSTTVVDAYLAPLLAAYLERLAARAGELGLPEPELMRSSGGLASLEEAGRSGAWSVLSGPAGGAVGAGLLARLSGEGNAIGLDMGGTSCDVCAIEDGKVRRSGSREIGGRPIQLPMVDVHTVGAGGGSIGWVDHGGALRVGARADGADTRPASCGARGPRAGVLRARRHRARGHRRQPGTGLSGRGLVARRWRGARRRRGPALPS